MGAAEYNPLLLQSMAYYSYTAVRAAGRKGLDCALEAIECIGFIRDNDLKGFVVVVPACVAFWHTPSLVDIIENFRNPDVMKHKSVLHWIH
jgi:hypothetical protein